MKAELTIDGSRGEGGGQMVRTSIALSIITGTPLHLVQIRSGRPKPGLQRQHVAAVRAAAEICGGRLDGAELHSRQIRFRPGAVRPGEYHFDVGSAGSVMLVLQTVLPPLLTAAAPSTLILDGGTHNAWAPPFDFLAHAFLPLVNRMGPTVTAHLERHGFYPAGGGRVHVRVEPVGSLAGFDLETRGEICSRRLTSLLARLPEQIGQREIGRALEQLAWPATSAEIRSVDSSGPGNALIAQVQCEQVTEVFTAFGRKGVPAERVADDLVEQVQGWLDSGVPVGPHLADQLLLPLALSAAQPAGGAGQRGGRFRTVPLQQHAWTQLKILSRFLDVQATVETSDHVLVRVEPIAA